MTSQYSMVEPAPHALYECRNPADFISSFEALTMCPVRSVADDVIAENAPRAVYLVASLPLGMGTSGSDVDFIVLVDSDAQLLKNEHNATRNTEQALAFFNSSEVLAGRFGKVINGVALEVQIAITPAVNRIRARLRSRGPELTESEIMVLGRLRSGWLLWQSEGYLERHALTLTEPSLDVYCCTKHFVAALIFRRKALGALEVADEVLAVHLGRQSVEMAYLAYFASEGLSYLGAKWLGQLGQAWGARDRVERHPLLKDSLHLLFPTRPGTSAQALKYLEEVAWFLTRMRALIERQTLFRIAFSACPQIRPIEPVAAAAR